MSQGTSPPSAAPVPLSLPCQEAKPRNASRTGWGPLGTSSPGRHRSRGAASYLLPSSDRWHFPKISSFPLPLGVDSLGEQKTVIEVWGGEEGFVGALWGGRTALWQHWSNPGRARWKPTPGEQAPCLPDFTELWRLLEPEEPGEVICARCLLYTQRGLEIRAPSPHVTTRFKAPETGGFCGHWPAAPLPRLSHGPQPAKSLPVFQSQSCFQTDRQRSAESGRCCFWNQQWQGKGPIC